MQHPQMKKRGLAPKFFTWMLDSEKICHALVQRHTSHTGPNLCCADPPNQHEPLGGVTLLQASSQKGSNIRAIS